MLFLGHMGIGSRLVQPWGSRLPRRWLLLGTVLSDLIDKPLYYLSAWITGRQSVGIGLISCTRTFGHSGLFLVLLCGIAVARRSRVMAALALGVGTHLLLDSLSDRMGGVPLRESSAYLALGFPLVSARFGPYPFESVGQYLRTLETQVALGGELLGALLLGWEEWKLRHGREVAIDARAFFRKIRRRRQDR